jgi:hypothetical protein
MSYIASVEAIIQYKNILLGGKIMGEPKEKKELIPYWIKIVAVFFLGEAIPPKHITVGVPLSTV